MSVTNVLRAASLDLPPTERRVLLELLLHGSQPRVRLAERLGLSRTSLTRIARGLIDAGLVVEGELQTTGSRGRPAESLDLRPAGAHFLGVKLTGDTAYFVLTDLAATVVATDSAPLLDRDPEAVIALIADRVARFAADGPGPAALGIAIAGDVVDRDGTAWLRRSDFLGWDDLPLADLVRAATGLPVTLANDVQALAGAYHWFGGLHSSRSLVLLGIGAGIGSGVVLDDELLLGANGRAGRVGHHRIGGEGRECENGHIDCVHSFVTIPAIERNAGVAAGEYHLALDRARGGEPAAVAAFAAAADALGVIIGAAVNVVDPEVVVIMGEGRDMIALFEDRVRASLAGELEQGDPDRVRIELPPFEFGLYARGAAVAAMREQLA